MKMPLLISLSLAAALGTFADKAADERDFLLHVNSYAAVNGYNCGGTEWSSPFGICGGNPAPDGRSLGFPTTAKVNVKWCNKEASPTACSIGEGRTMPARYARWMKFCIPAGADDCGANNNWILGAVQMPNGPFHVLDGRIGGKKVLPDDGNQDRIGQSNGPLNLVVTWKGGISNGGGVPASNGYTFGIVGKIKLQ